ncbi:MAG: hypothetical protein EWM47_00200 [Anaerolineaceae bacterium]|nr:MAG: hypothetical protein EWM47_00200 [Anaerolineaceae bacterium]
MIIENRLDELDKKTIDTQLTIENVINKNIQIIAEGHLDLNRKLDAALKSDSEKEMLLIRVNYIEDELRKIKKHVEVK